MSRIVPDQRLLAMGRLKQFTPVVLSLGTAQALSPKLKDVVAHRVVSILSRLLAEDPKSLISVLRTNEGKAEAQRFRALDEFAAEILAAPGAPRRSILLEALTALSEASTPVSQTDAATLTQMFQEMGLFASGVDGTTATQSASVTQL